MRLYYKTLSSVTHVIKYNKSESIWTLKPMVYKTLDLNILDNYKFKYIGKVLADETFISNESIMHNTFEDGVSKYKCKKTIYCASSVDFEPIRSFRRNLVVI